LVIGGGKNLHFQQILRQSEAAGTVEVRYNKGFKILD
jgi:hypothetical protein